MTPPGAVDLSSACIRHRLIPGWIAASLWAYNGMTVGSVFCALQTMDLTCDDELWLHHVAAVSAYARICVHSAVISVQKQ